MGALRKMEIIQVFADFFKSEKSYVSPEEKSEIEKLEKLGDKVCTNVTLVGFEPESNNKKDKNNRVKVKPESEISQTKEPKVNEKKGRGGRE